MKNFSVNVEFKFSDKELETSKVSQSEGIGGDIPIKDDDAPAG